MSFAVSKAKTDLCTTCTHSKGNASNLASYIDFIELEFMKTPSCETLEASNKSALLFQDLFCYGADKSTEHDKC